MKQREIKFRAWVDKNSRWGDNSEVGMFTGFTFDSIYAGSDESYISCEDGKEIEQPQWDRIVLMQYTGLKDKNGKEIYEGDILKTYVETGIDSYWKTCKVVWNKMGGAFILKARTNDEKSWYSLSKIPAGELEIIGNIYENPELLK